MDFNHISKNLTKEQVSKLKNLYYTYHRQFWCYKRCLKILNKQIYFYNYHP